MVRENGKEMISPVDLTEARKYLSELMPQAGETLRRYFNSGDFTLRSKGGVDFVTQADEEVDAFLHDNIQKKYPQTTLLTEETAPADYSSLKDVDNLWVIDPLDGTVNFSRRHPNFAISVGLVDKGIPKLGVVYLPITQDLYWAQADQEDTFLNGEPIHVSTTDDMTAAVIGCDWPWNLERRADIVRWLGNMNTQVR